MKKSERTITLSILFLLMDISSSHAAGHAAGLSCSNPAGTIEFGIGSEAMDDLLACVGGTWHSMIYGGAAPAGAIEAFNLSLCPAGWTAVPALAGRTIIGAGQGNGLSFRSPQDYGGEERHVMTVGELVPHNVTFTFGASDKGGRGNGYAYSDNAGGSSVRAVYDKTSGTVGGGQPFNVMMPYYALLYCMKQ